MTVNLYMTWETPYLPAVAGLTVEAWPASDFTHSPVGNPSAYPPAPSPTATTTTDSSGDCELTGLTAATDYYISIIDQNNQPWFQFCPGGYLGNSSGTRRRWSINPGPTPAAAPVAAGRLIFLATLASFSCGNLFVTIPFPSVLFDPYSGATGGNSYTVPAALAGSNLNAEYTFQVYGPSGAHNLVVAQIVASPSTSFTGTFALQDLPPEGYDVEQTASTNLIGWSVAAAVDLSVQAHDTTSSATLNSIFTGPFAILVT